MTSPESIAFALIPDYGQFKDLTTQPFGRWVVLGFAGKRGFNEYWWCRCKCGKVKAVFRGSLKNGTSVSCGCYSSECKAARITHGCSKRGQGNGAYMSWRHMRRQGRANICAAWWDSFEAFYAAMGSRPKGKELCRKDTGLPFSPDNCLWGTRKWRQNHKKNNRFLTYKGETLCIAAWAEKHGMTTQKLWRRLRNKSLAEALAMP